MRVLVDTNVILDVLCNHEGVAKDSLRIFQCCETGQMAGYISALSVPNIVYIMRKELNQQRIKDILEVLVNNRVGRGILATSGCRI